MIDLIRAGGPLVTIPQTLLLLGLLGLVLKIAFDLRRSGTGTTALRRRVDAVLQLGVLALFVGILGQTIGLVEALNAIREAGDISPGLVIQGFIVSLIAPLYGLSICLASVAVWLFLRRRAAGAA